MSTGRRDDRRSRSNTLKAGLPGPVASLYGAGARPSLRTKGGHLGGRGEGHRIGIGRGLAVALFAAFAAYAALLALFAQGAESVWGAWAAGGYAAASLTAAWCWKSRPSVPLLLALLGGFAVPAALLPVNWGATSEVRVVARAAALWLAHGTPYLASSHLASWRSYDPYLPGMSLFGLPHALGLAYPLGDPLLWLAATTAVLLYAACRIAAPMAARWCAGCRHQAGLRTLLLLACPVFALPMALGVTDQPVIALLCLSLAFTARSHRHGPSPAPKADLGTAGGGAEADRTSARWGHPLLAGLAVGAACALKATAWPALPVLAALLWVRDGRRTALRFAAASLGTFFAFVVVTAPALLDHPDAFWQNIVAYPLGISRRMTQAVSPLPGHLLASTGTLGHAVAIVLLAAAALAIGASLVLRPPRNVRQASMRLAVALAVMFVLAPDARFGYFAYPVGILFWLVLTVPSAGRVRSFYDVHATALSGEPAYEREPVAAQPAGRPRIDVARLATRRASAVCHNVHAAEQRKVPLAARVKDGLRWTARAGWLLRRMSMRYPATR